MGAWREVSRADGGSTGHISKCGVARKPGWRGKRAWRVHIEIAGPMPVKLAGRREYVYVVVDDYVRAVFDSRLRLK